VFVHKENHLAQRGELQVEHGKVHELRFSLSAVTLWSAVVSGNVLSVPVVADFDGDGSGDVVIGDDDGRIYCLSGRNGIPIWVSKAGNSVQAPFSLADMDGNGSPDVIVGSTDGAVYCLNGRTGQSLWTAQTQGPILGPVLLRDVNGDKEPDAFFGSDDGSVYAVNGRTGQWLWRRSVSGRVGSCLSWAKDRNTTVLLAGTLDKVLHVIRPGDGEVIGTVSVEAPLAFPPRVEDLSQNGEWVAVFPVPQSATDPLACVAVSLSARQQIPAPSELPHWIDFDGDGRLEKLVATGEGTRCWENDGKTLRWRSPYVAIAPYTADINADGVMDLVFNNGPDALLGLSGQDGSVIGHIILESGSGRGMALDDVDRDGLPDVVLGAGRKVMCFSWSGGRKQWLTKAKEYFDAALAVSGGRVIAKDIGGTIAAYERGQSLPVWSVATSTQPAPYSAPSADDEIVVDMDAHARKLRSFEARTGKVIWEVSVPGMADTPAGTPTLSGRVVLVSDGISNLVCVSRLDGAELWRQVLTGGLSPATVSGDRVWAADGVNTLVCLALVDGKKLWTFTASDPFLSAPVGLDLNEDDVADALAVCGNGYVYALDGMTGAELWKIQYSNQRSRSRNRLLLADVTGDGVPEGILATVQGGLKVLDLKNREMRQAAGVVGPVMSEPALCDVNDDKVPDIIVGTMNRRLVCVSGKDLSVLWTYELGAQVRYSVPVCLPDEENETVVVMVGTGPPENGLYCLRASAPAGKGRAWTGPWRVDVREAR
jgi:outer membrane protein assembly factor BamB